MKVNTNPLEFNDLDIYASDNFKDAANVKIRNLVIRKSIFETG